MILKINVIIEIRYLFLIMMKHIDIYIYILSLYHINKLNPLYNIYVISLMYIIYINGNKNDTIKNYEAIN